MNLGNDVPPTEIGGNHGTEILFYLFTNQSTHGPYDSLAVGSLLRSSRISSDTPACRAGDTSWTRLGDVLPQLFIQQELQPGHTEPYLVPPPPPSPSREGIRNDVPPQEYPATQPIPKPQPVRTVIKMRNGMMALKCPACHEYTTASETEAGKEVRCYSCKKPMETPGPGIRRWVFIQLLVCLNVVVGILGLIPEEALALKLLILLALLPIGVWMHIQRLKNIGAPLALFALAFVPLVNLIYSIWLMAVKENSMRKRKAF